MDGAGTEYVGGFTGFGAGYIPTDPGAYLANYLYYYDAKTASVAVNGKVALNVSTSVYFEIPQVTYITKLTFLGGNYGFGIAVPVGYVSVDVGINPAGIDRSASSFGLGDSIDLPDCRVKALALWVHDRSASQLVRAFAPRAHTRCVPSRMSGNQ